MFDDLITVEAFREKRRSADRRHVPPEEMPPPRADHKAEIRT